MSVSYKMLAGLDNVLIEGLFTEFGIILFYLKKALALKGQQKVCI